MKYTNKQREELLKAAIYSVDEEILTNKEKILQETSIDLLLQCKNELQILLDCINTDNGDLSKLAKSSGMGRAIVDTFPIKTSLGEKILSALHACL